MVRDFLGGIFEAVAELGMTDSQYARHRLRQADKAARNVPMKESHLFGTHSDIRDSLSSYQAAFEKQKKALEYITHYGLMNAPEAQQTLQALGYQVAMAQNDLLYDIEMASNETKGILETHTYTNKNIWNGDENSDVGRTTIKGAFTDDEWDYLNDTVGHIQIQDPTRPGSTTTFGNWMWTRHETKSMVRGMNDTEFNFLDPTDDNYGKYYDKNKGKWVGYKNKPNKILGYTTKLFPDDSLQAAMYEGSVRTLGALYEQASAKRSHKQKIKRELKAEFGDAWKEAKAMGRIPYMMMLEDDKDKKRLAEQEEIDLLELEEIQLINESQDIMDKFRGVLEAKGVKYTLPSDWEPSKMKITGMDTVKGMDETVREFEMKPGATMLDPYGFAQVMKEFVNNYNGEWTKERVATLLEGGNIIKSDGKMLVFGTKAQPISTTRQLANTLGVDPSQIDREASTYLDESDVVSDFIHSVLNPGDQVKSGFIMNKDDIQKGVQGQQGHSLFASEDGLSGNSFDAVREVLLDLGNKTLTWGTDEYQEGTLIYSADGLYGGDKTYSLYGDNEKELLEGFFSEFDDIEEAREAVLRYVGQLNTMVSGRGIEDATTYMNGRIGHGARSIRNWETEDLVARTWAKNFSDMGGNPGPEPSPTPKGKPKPPGPGATPEEIAAYKQLRIDEDWSSIDAMELSDEHHAVNELTTAGTGFDWISRVQIYGDFMSEKGSIMRNHYEQRMFDIYDVSPRSGESWGDFRLRKMLTVFSEVEHDIFKQLHIKDRNKYYNGISLAMREAGVKNMDRESQWAWAREYKNNNLPAWLEKSINDNEITHVGWANNIPIEKYEYIPSWKGGGKDPYKHETYEGPSTWGKASGTEKWEPVNE